jgi:hypothetical protein
MISPGLWHRALVNALAFRLREAVRWRRAGYAEAPADVAALVAAHPRAERLRALRTRYSPRLGHLSAANVLENLNALHHLDAATEGLAWAPAGTIRALDVGTQNFYAAPALHAFWGRFGVVERLTGIELDAHQVYVDGHSRADHAAFHAAHVPGCRFIAGDVRALSEPVNAITWLLPFLHPEPHLAWGLPAGRHDPDATFAHVWGLLEPGGLMVLANRGELERDAQHALLARMGLKFRPAVAIEDPLVAGRETRHLTGVQKPA